MSCNDFLPGVPGEAEHISAQIRRPFLRLHEHRFGMMHGASVWTLVLLLLAPVAEAASSFAALSTTDSPSTQCPCCRGKTKCDRHEHQHPVKTDAPQIAELAATCPCPMALPVSTQSPGYRPVVEASEIQVFISVKPLRLADCHVRAPRSSPAHPRRGPPVSASSAA